MSNKGPVDRFQANNNREAMRRANTPREWRDGDQAVKSEFNVFDHPTKGPLVCRNCGRTMQTGQRGQSVVVDAKGTREYQHASADDCDLEVLTIRERRRARNRVRVALRHLEGNLSTGVDTDDD